MRECGRVLLNSFDDKPVRIWSVIVTIYGDCVVPRGGEMRLATLSEILGFFGIEAGAVRASVSRLTRDSILERRREGRTSHYRLTASASAITRSASLRIYSPTVPQHTEAWDIAVVLAGAAAAAKATLLGEGFTQLAQGVFTRPAHSPKPEIDDVVVLTATADDPSVSARLVPLDRLAARYNRFSHLAHEHVLGAGDLSGEDATALRIALVHGFRRIVLRDPLLPLAALPADWPAPRAYATFQQAYAKLRAPSDVWLSAAIGPAQETPGAAPGVEHVTKHELTSGIL